jgi:methionine sulfoxide reductase catalytic subunit
MANPWDLPSREVTPESAVLSRRRWLARVGLGAGLTAAGAGAFWWWNGGRDDDVLNAGRDAVPTDLFPAVRNPSFLETDRPLTAESSAARYCNFYEFSTTKQVWRWITPFHPVPWTLEVGGLVAKPQTFDLDDLLHTFASALEERAYRHRCVEAWAMAVPWTGFPLSALLRRVAPLPGARFVRFTTFDRPAEASRQADRSEPWPYTEGLTLAEAGNELTFLAVGMYGHPLLKQHGAPCPAGSAVEIRLQERQIAGAHRVDGLTAGDVLEHARPQRIRLHRQRQSRHSPSALEPGQRTYARHGRETADAAV